VNFVCKCFSYLNVNCRKTDLCSDVCNPTANKESSKDIAHALSYTIDLDYITLETKLLVAEYGTTVKCF
jgi:hypothetical protein